MYYNWNISQMIGSGMEVLFKGVRLNRGIREVRGLEIIIDIYGMDTKNSLTLDRENLKLFARKEIENILDKVLEIYVKKLKELIENKKEQIDREAIYTVYNLLENSNNGILSKNEQELIKKSEDKFQVFEFDGDRYQKKDKKLFELVNLRDKYMLVDLNKKERKLKRLCKLCNRIEKKGRILIVDQEFIEDCWNKSVSYIKIYQGENILLYKIEDDNNYKAINVDNETKRILIMGLCGMKNNNRGSMRTKIPAIKEYEVLSTDGIVPKWGLESIIELEQKIPYIISPISKNDEQERQKYQKEQFIEYVTSKPEFDNIVKYVKEHTIFPDPPKEEEMIEKYKELIGEYYDLKQEEVNKNQTEY